MAREGAGWLGLLRAPEMTQGGRRAGKGGAGWLGLLRARATGAHDSERPTGAHQSLLMRRSLKAHGAACLRRAHDSAACVSSPMER